MSSSPGAAIIISLVLAIALSATPVTCAMSFPQVWPTSADLFAGGPVLQDNAVSSKVTVIDESFNGRTIQAARGETLLVQLSERDIDRTWHFDGGSSFSLTGDAILEMYPARHDFRVKVLGPGDLRFKKIDRRDGFVVDTFSVTITLKESKPEKDSTKSYPLWGLDATGPEMIAFPFWQ